MLRMGTILLHDASTNTSEVKPDKYSHALEMQNHINVRPVSLSHVSIYDMF